MVKPTLVKCSQTCLHTLFRWFSSSNIGSWGLNPGGGQNFPDPSRLAPRPTQHPVRWVPGLLPRRKAAGVWHWPLNPFQCQCQVWVELYLYFPTVPAWHVTGLLPLPLYMHLVTYFHVSLPQSHYILLCAIADQVWRWQTDATRYNHMFMVLKTLKS